MADAMVASGMKAAGYEYICIDDLWHGGRSRAGDLFPDPKRFRRGIKLITDVFVYRVRFRASVSPCGSGDD